MLSSAKELLRGVRRHRRRLHRGWLLGALAGMAAALGIVIGIDRVFFAPGTQAACRFQPSGSSRPGLQRILDDAVKGKAKLAPGATAYVAGPHGVWTGAAGTADTSTCAPMTVDARVRLESVSKIFTATLILQLAQEGKLRVTDTVARWLPGLLPYGDRITIRQLLTMTSGLIDNNDFVNASAGAKRRYLARVEDAKLRRKLLEAITLVDENPAAVVPATLWVRWAAWQRLLFPPGTSGHYSNIGYDVLGLIAARAGGQPLRVLYRRKILEPLDLHATAYDPQGPIHGPHAEGYGIEPDGTEIDATDWHYGVGADGGIVSDAADTAAFLTALMRGELLDRRHLAEMEGEDLWNGGAPTGCAGNAFGWSGGGSGYKTEVWVADGGDRVAVLLLDARHWDTAQPVADQDAHDMLRRLYCAA